MKEKEILRCALINRRVISLLNELLQVMAYDRSVFFPVFALLEKIGLALESEVDV